MEKKRDRRIRDKQRMKKKARRLYPHNEHGTLADNLAHCSCWMCGNPRKFFKGKYKYSLQEMKHMLDGPDDL